MDMDNAVIALAAEARVRPLTQPNVGSCPTLPDAVRADAALAAQASPWLDTYIAHSLLWSPRSYHGYHEACALWILSTVAARRVAIHFGKVRYSPLYICLTGRSSIYAKSTAAGVAIQTMEDAGLDHLLAPDDATPAAFVASLVERLPATFGDYPEQTQQKILQRLAFAAQRGWFYEEFGQKISGMMRENGTHADFRGLLRKFDETPKRYEYQTVGRGSDLVRRPYLALLGCLTPADLAPFARRGSALWGDGFLARFSLVCPAEGNKRRRDLFPEGERHTPIDLITALQTWHQRLGNAPATVEARGNEEKPDLVLHTPQHEPMFCTFGEGVYAAYGRYDNALLDIVEESTNTDLDGNYARLPEKALRVAMLLASLENGGRIELTHWHRGQQIAEGWRHDLHALYDQVNGSDQSSANDTEERVLTLIQRKGTVTAREVAQSIRSLDSGQAKLILENLAHSGEIETYREGKKQLYTLSVHHGNMGVHEAVDPT